MAYQNLKAEMVRHEISQADAASFLGMSANNFSLKVREKVPLTVPELKQIRDKFLPDVTLDYLAETDQEH